MADADVLSLAAFDQRFIVGQHRAGIHGVIPGTFQEIGRRNFHSIPWTMLNIGEDALVSFTHWLLINAWGLQLHVRLEDMRIRWSMGRHCREHTWFGRSR